MQLEDNKNKLTYNFGLFYFISDQKIQKNSPNSVVIFFWVLSFSKPKNRRKKKKGKPIRNKEKKSEKNVRSGHRALNTFLIPCNSASKHLFLPCNICDFLIIIISNTSVN